MKETDERENAAEGMLCPFDGVWDMAGWRMQGRNHLKKCFKDREKENCLSARQFTPQYPASS